MDNIKINDSINLHPVWSDKFNTVSICLILKRPLKREEVTQNALLPKVLRSASKKYNSLRKINAETDNMYGAVFDASILKKGEYQLLQFFIETVDKKELLEKAFSLLSEIILNPLVENNSFKKDIVEREKINLEKEIKNRNNDKKEYVRLKCIEHMCKNEPFGIYADGYSEDLNGINEKNLYEHYKKLIESTKFDFFICGNFDIEHITNIINNTFSNIKVIETPPSPDKTDLAPSKQNKEAKKIIDEMDISQGKLCIGARTNTSPTGKEFFALIVGNEIFGGGANSKLFTNVREKESLCYYINSFLYRFKSIMCIQSGVDKENLEKTLDYCQKSLDEIKNGNFSENELKSAKEGIRKKYLSTLDYPVSLMDFSLSQYMLGEKDDIKEAAEKTDNVTKDDIKEAFKGISLDTIYFCCGKGE